MTDTHPSARLLHDEYSADKYMFKEGGDRCLASGPRRARSCTDIVCLMIFFICMLVFCSLALFGFAKGDVKVLDVYRHPFDHNGNSCGLANMTDYKYEFFSPRQPSNVTVEVFERKDGIPLLTPVCTAVCPTDKISPNCSKDDNIYCDWTKVENRVNTTAVGHFCFDSNMVSDWLIQADNLRNSWPVLLCGFFLILVLGFAFLFVVKMCTGAIFIGTIGGLVVALIAMGVLALSQKQHVMDTKRVTSDSVVAFAVSCFVMSAIVSIFALVYYKTIRLSVQILKTAAMFLMDVKSQMVKPVFFGIFHILFTLAWVGCAVALWTVDAVAGTCCHKNEADSSVICLVDHINPFCVEHNSDHGFVFVVFMVVFLLWVQGMISGLSHFTTAYAAGVWYFSGTNHDQERDLPGGNTFCDCRLTFRGMRIGAWFHTGSFAFGGLLCSICKLISCLAIPSDRHGHEGSVPNLLVACMSCFSRCILRFIGFISVQAYIQAALLGTGFCESGRSALSITVRHPLRVALSSKTSSLIEFVGATTITAATVCVGYYLMGTSMVHGVTDFTPGLIVLGIMAVVVSLSMMQPYSTATMTIMHCFVADEDMSKSAGFAGARHTPEPLVPFVRESAELN